MCQQAEISRVYMSADSLRFEFGRGRLTDVARDSQGASQRRAYLS